MTLSCIVTPAADIDASTRAWLIANGTHDGSDFQTTLARQLKPAGAIAIVREDDEIVGWARTEPWTDDDRNAWPTLEAFVVPEWRSKGIAAFAAAGIAAGGLGGSACAVFAPSMLLVAARAGFLWPTLFQRDADRKWVRA